MCNKDARFTDYQVLTLVKAHPDSSMSDILRYAQQEMPSFVWTIGKVQKALGRLHEHGKVSFFDGERSVTIPTKTVKAR